MTQIDKSAAVTNENGFYLIHLDDYATSSFCSFVKPFFGTLTQINVFIADHKNDKDRESQISEIVTAFEKWKAGERDITHTVAFNEQPLLIPASPIYSAKHSLKQYYWDHLNIWDCVYHLRCSKVDTDHRWIECDRQYYRYMTAVFEDLEIQSHDGQWRSFRMPWGIPHMLYFKENRVRNRLAALEKSFGTKQEMEQDYQKFLKKPTPVFEEICNEIFGDG